MLVRRGLAAPTAAAPVEEEAVDRNALGRKRRFDSYQQGIVFLGADRGDAEPRADGLPQSLLERRPEQVELRLQRLGRRDEKKRAGELKHVPMDRLRLPAE